ncbi:unnamed protein product [Closterium sp. NIES-65]|nr:unnamed protein product [Closterium sp. NIES-65]
MAWLLSRLKNSSRFSLTPAGPDDSIVTWLRAALASPAELAAAGWRHVDASDWLSGGRSWRLEQRAAAVMGRIAGGGVTGEETEREVSRGGLGLHGGLESTQKSLFSNTHSSPPLPFLSPPMTFESTQKSLFSDTHSSPPLPFLSPPMTFESTQKSLFSDTHSSPPLPFLSPPMTFESTQKSLFSDTHSSPPLPFLSPPMTFESTQNRLKSHSSPTLTLPLLYPSSPPQSPRPGISPPHLCRLITAARVYLRLISAGQSQLQGYRTTIEEDIALLFNAPRCKEPERWAVAAVLSEKLALLGVGIEENITVDEDVHLLFRAPQSKAPARWAVAAALSEKLALAGAIQALQRL